MREDIGSINHIAIDGKSLRGSRKTSSKYSAVHVVSAFALEARLTLAQAKAPSKGGGKSEALLEIISYLKLNKAVITADAGVCHRKVAQGIVDKKADYILALKGNQGNAYEAVVTYLNNSSLLKQCAYAEAFDKGYGRIETRKCWVTSDLRALEELPQWSNLKNIVCVENTRDIKGKQSIERRYYLSSLENFLKIIRAHWSIENSLHWVMDVTFAEDNCRARTKNAPENMALLRRLASNVLQKIKKPGESLRGLRIRAAANEEVLLAYVKEF